MRLGVTAALVDGVLVAGDVAIEDGLVAGLGLAGPGRGIAVPGLVDLQVNGYAGVDVLTAGVEELRAMGVALARDGVLAYQPTLITAPQEAALAALERIAQAGAGEREGARILGAHLEGPFLSPARHGAHPPHLLRTPSAEALAPYLATGCTVGMVTLAPELEGAPTVIAELASRGIVVALGHSDATAEQAHVGFDAGARAVTHLFNAMRPFAHRDPGLVGAALARPDVTVTVIADGVHVAPEALLTAWRAAEHRLALVSDTIAAAGRGDGEVALGPVTVTVRGDEARLPDGTLAGAVRPLVAGVRALVELGVPLPKAVDAATRVPAALVGRPELARLAVGAPADLVVLDDACAVVRVLAGGVEP